jgi:hypothetical protein
MAKQMGKDLTQRAQSSEHRGRREKRGCNKEKGDALKRAPTKVPIKRKRPGSAGAQYFTQISLAE